MAGRTIGGIQRLARDRGGDRESHAEHARGSASGRDGGLCRGRACRDPAARAVRTAVAGHRRGGLGGRRGSCSTPSPPYPAVVPPMSFCWLSCWNKRRWNKGFSRPRPPARTPDRRRIRRPARRKPRGCGGAAQGRDQPRRHHRGGAEVLMAPDAAGGDEQGDRRGNGALARVGGVDASPALRGAVDNPVRCGLDCPGKSRREHAT